jgi:hypothetical protein
MTGFVIFMLIIVAVISAAIDRSIRQGKANAAAGVIAHWEGLRVTRTELIQGYSQNAPRHPLKGVKARVEDTGARVRGGKDDRRIHVIIEGPGIAIVKTKKVAATYNGDALARQFAATLNVASALSTAT